MPTTYTHYRYGQNVLKRLPERIQGDLIPYMDYYNIGVHGPDILFYYRPFCRNRINRYGVRVHHEPARQFFSGAMKIFEDRRCRPEDRAYLAGFMTHFILDSTCHPYINRRAKVTGVSHTEIETDLDMVIMEEEGLKPLAVHKTKEIKPSLKAASVIAPYYDKTVGEIFESILGQKLIVDYIFRSPTGLKRSLSRRLSRILGLRYRKGSIMAYLDAHFTGREIHPDNRETIETLKGMISSCEQEGADMTTALCDALEDQDRTFLNHERLKRKFS